MARLAKNTFKGSNSRIYVTCYGELHVRGSLSSGEALIAVTVNLEFKQTERMSDLPYMSVCFCQVGCHSIPESQVGFNRSDKQIKHYKCLLNLQERVSRSNLCVLCLPNPTHDFNNSKKYPRPVRSLFSNNVITRQWCSEQHPDPRFEQFAVLQEAILNLRNGTLSFRKDNLSILVQAPVALPSEEERSELLIHSLGAVRRPPSHKQ